MHSLLAPTLTWRHPGRAALILGLCAGVAVACGGGGGGAAAGGGGGGGGGGPPQVTPGLELSDLTASPGTTAGSVVLRFTAPSPAADAYVVRSRVRLLDTEADVAAAATLPHGTTPSAPGTPETIQLTGLEGGQTLQFAVQVRRGTVTAPFGYAVSCRVPAAAPSAPAGAILISGPTTLSTDGATYLLTNDVTAAGTAFTLTGRNVTLDLGGHKVTYGTAPGTAYGVYSEFLYDSGVSTVRNGRLIQGGANGAQCHGVWFRGGHQIRLTGLDVTVQGPDSDGLVIGDTPTSDVRVDHCTVHCNTTVDSNRSYPGVSAIVLETITRGVEIDHNRVFSSPQWGIKCQGNATTGEATIHHNRVTGTKALYANGYMIGCYKPRLDVFENELVGESRGVHLDAIDGAGRDCRVHDNRLVVQDQPNAEYPDFHWVHGVKIEGASGAFIYRNSVTGIADDAHAEVRCLDVDCGNSTGIVVEKNRFLATAVTAKYRGHALQWTGGALGPTNDTVIRQNVFRATDRLIVRAWGSERGTLIRDNAWARDLAQGPAHPFLFEYFDSSDTASSPGHRLLDPVTTEDLRAVDQWQGAGPYSSTREWSLTVVAVDGSGQPVPSATVTVRNAAAAVAFSGTTDAQGRIVGTVVQTTVANGPAFSDQGPFQVVVSKSGFPTHTTTIPVTSRTALRVDLSANASALDATAPDAIAGLSRHVLSATRVYLHWTPATDPSGIAGYLVTMDGELVGLTDENQFVVAGLLPSTAYGLSVQAVDRGGNVSPTAAALPVTTGPEDRGP